MRNRPGSPEAREVGCTCPADDNDHGRGAPDANRTTYVISRLCPLHGYTDLADQIRELLADRAGRVADLLSDPELRADLEVRAEQAVSRLVGELTGDDERTAAEVIADLVALAHGDGAERPEWWRTPLGRVAARSLHRDDADAVTPTMAARMLGISPQTVYRWREQGRLDRHPDGGVTRSSVLARIGQP